MNKSNNVLYLYIGRFTRVGSLLKPTDDMFCNAVNIIKLIVSFLDV